MQFIEIKDFFLLPLYLAIIYAFAYRSRNSLYSVRHPLHQYYIPALSCRIVGSLSLGLVYQYYYGYGGDTGSYFYNSKLIAEYFNTDPGTYFDLVFKPIITTIDVRKTIPWNDDVFGFNEANFFPIRILAVLQLFTFGTYLPSSLFFAFIAFSSTWKLYLAFVNMFPALYKQFAIAFLFMPSVFFWGSGILKDTICMSALCWLFYSSYDFLILGRNWLKNAIVIFLCTIVIVIIKSYIALAFLPGMLIWIFLTYKNRIRSQALRTVAMPFLIFLILSGSFYFFRKISEQDARFSSEQIQNQAVVINNTIVEAGSAVNIGVTSGMGPAQLLQIAPLAIFTAIFRPFLFEIRNPLMLLSAMEGTYILYLFWMVIFKTGVTRSFRVVMGTPLVLFSIIFSIGFAFAVGFSTSNFGTLVRYKIPLIPFFIASLFITIYIGKMRGTKQ